MASTLHTPEQPAELKSYVEFACGARIAHKGEPDLTARNLNSGHAGRVVNGERRLEITVWKSTGGLTKPTMPDGTPAQCVMDCPKRGRHRKEVRFLLGDEWPKSGPPETGLSVTCCVMREGLL